MARFGLNDTDNYGGEGLANFFSLADDGDSAIVRFMYDSLDDISGYAVHRIKTGDDKEIIINCLRSYEDPLDTCPLCANKNFQMARFYFSLYNEDASEIQIWTRGKQIVSELVKCLSQVNGPISGAKIRITRKGEKGDKYTKYLFELVDEDGLELEELIANVGEPTDPVGTLIKDYTFDELNDYVSTGKLPGLDMNNSGSDNNIAYRNTNNNNNTNTEQPVLRRQYIPGRNNNNSSVF